MARVYLSLGSNQNRDHYIRQGLDALIQAFACLNLSSVYESEAVGFSGDAFYNLVVGLDTSLSVAQLSALLKGIEDANGRDRSAPRFCGRTLDIDILTYDQAAGEIDSVRLPRAEILKNAFVLQPLAEIAGAEVHPVVGATYAELWQAYAGQQKLWPVKFEWRETLLPARIKI